MCGISGIIAFTKAGEPFLNKIPEAVATMRSRGPDKEGVFYKDKVALGHNRLSIIDVSNAASQPFTDASGRYTIVFNGEFYNYKTHRQELAKEGIQFVSQSDTEVLLYLYIKEGPACLQKVNGFFAFAIYDSLKKAVFIARDRMGIKPLLISYHEDAFFFASEMKAMFAMGVKKEIDHESLLAYLQMNYTPAHFTMVRNVVKLKPVHFILVDDNNEIVQQPYYKIPYEAGQVITHSDDYDTAKKKIATLLEQSVEKRMVADVPLGAFLSGGLDSSIIVALATRFTKQLSTFSIGFKDEAYFDETQYADLVAKKFNTYHTTFSLTNDDLFSVLFEVLDYIDDPFADSSAIAVNILSKKTREHVSVALSGDGADELFGGYIKHVAELRIRNAGISGSILKGLSPLLTHLPQSRNSGMANKIRQASKFAKGISLSRQERYWRWCSFIDEEKAGKLLKLGVNQQKYNRRKNLITSFISEKGSMNDVLMADTNHVLVNDMLTKVDLMSMANSLEVRVPFLDYELVNYVFSLPDSFKIHKNKGKRILQDAFSDVLPNEITGRPKHGFEVPLLKWFRRELFSLIKDDLLSDAFIEEQNIFNVAETKKLITRLQSNNPGDVAAQIWGIIVFQYWWKKNIKN